MAHHSLVVWVWGESLLLLTTALCATAVLLLDRRYRQGHRNGRDLFAPLFLLVIFFAPLVGGCALGFDEQVARWSRQYLAEALEPGLSREEVHDVLGERRVLAWRSGNGYEEYYVRVSLLQTDKVGVTFRSGATLERSWIGPP